MTQPAQQPEYIITEDKLRQLEMRFIYHNMEKDEPDVFAARSEFMKEVRSRLHTSTLENDYRDLFVSDLIALIEWDARHGNPELFKAVNSLKQHYKKFTVEQHDTAIRNATLDAIDKFCFDTIPVDYDTEYAYPDRFEHGQRFAYNAVRNYIESLRSTQPQEPHP